MSHSFLNYLKSRVRRNRLIESMLFYIYTRFTFSYRTVQATVIYFLMLKIQQLVFKKDVRGVEIHKNKIILEMNKDLKFYWNPGDRMSLLGMGLTGEWEHDDTEYIKKLIRMGDTVIDVGANYGFHTILFSKLIGSRGKVYAFEPLKSMFRQLERNIYLNNTQENTVSERYALGEKRGRATMYVPKRMGRGAASLSKRGETVEKDTCEIIKLDTYVNSKKIKKINFIKCDIEGAELLFLKGARQVIIRDNPIIMVEVTRGSSESFGYTPEILLQFLSDLNYEFYSAMNGRVSRIKNRDIPYFHGNCFAISRN